jgi:hypothetical protein
MTTTTNNALFLHEFPIDARGLGEKKSDDFRTVLNPPRRVLDIFWDSCLKFEGRKI